jgi:hypothetical protein
MTEEIPSCEPRGVDSTPCPNCRSTQKTLIVAEDLETGATGYQCGECCEEWETGDGV